MIEDRPRTHYEVLDIPMSSTPEKIREAYVRAKNAYSSHSLAAYSLFSVDESKEIVAEIEKAYSILSDSQRRKNYDREHGFMVTSTDANPRPQEDPMRIESGEEVAEIGFTDEPDDMITEHEHSVNVLGAQNSFDFGIASDDRRVASIANSWGNTDSPSQAVQADSENLLVGNSEDEFGDTHSTDEFTMAAPAEADPFASTSTSNEDANSVTESTESFGENTEASSAISDTINEFSDTTKSDQNVATSSLDTESPSFDDEASIDQETGALRTGATNHFALHGHYIQKQKSESPDFAAMIESAEKIDGSFLKKIRGLKSITMDEIMDFTKLSRKYVDALERDDLDKLPAPVYVRGFVTQYAKALRLDTKTIAAGYMRNFQDLRESRGIR